LLFLCGGGFYFYLVEDDAVTWGTVLRASLALVTISFPYSTQPIKFQVEADLCPGGKAVEQSHRYPQKIFVFINHYYFLITYFHSLI
jgi:hypothetical protein